MQLSQTIVSEDYAPEALQAVPGGYGTHLGGKVPQQGVQCVPFCQRPVA